MNTDRIEKQFARIGARLMVRERQQRFSLDIGRDRQGPLFVVGLNGTPTQISACDVQPRQRHLLLVVDRVGVDKFLCGHDERDWFVAAVPASGVSSVRGAMESLRPAQVQAALMHKHVKRQRRNRRRNAAFVRQGEWFFLPEPKVEIDPLFVIHNEPLRRGRGKSHWVEFLCRHGGELVYVSNEHPDGISETRYRRLITERPAKARLRWTSMRRNPVVYARGHVRHPDHKTIVLDGWHRVLMNTENQAASMQHLAFLD